MEDNYVPTYYENHNRVLDQDGNELDINTIDLNHGKLIEDTILLRDIPYQPVIEPIEHFEVERFYFDDGTSMEIEDTYNDPHVEIIDDKTCSFRYVDQGEGKVWNYEMDTVRVIEKEGQGEIPAERVYENIRRYIPFTPEEQAEFDAYMTKETNKQILLETGLERLMNTENNIDDVMLLLAEMIGV